MEDIEFSAKELLRSSLNGLFSLVSGIVLPFSTTIFFPILKQCDDRIHIFNPWISQFTIINNNLTFFDSYTLSYCVNFSCKYFLGRSGKLEAFSQKDAETLVRNVIEPMASDGLRTICVAYKVGFFF